MNIHEITCTQALNKLNRRQPYGWDLNIYRGCRHACAYCFAIYSHQYIHEDANDFYNEIYVKTNIVERLEQHLRKKSWKQEIINIGGVTDSYQATEAQYKLMPEILKLLIKYKTPTIISTKSSLILRDYDLIDELSRITYINIAASIITTDRTVQKQLEPNAAPPMARFELLEAFSKTNASLGVHLMPIIPLLTDSEENLETICAQANAVHVNYVLPGTLYLRGKTKPQFLTFMQKNYPQNYAQFYQLFHQTEQRKLYKNELYRRIKILENKYQLSSNYANAIQARLYRAPQQLVLF